MANFISAYIVLVYYLSVFGCGSRGLENIDGSLEYRTAPCPESYEHFQESCYKLYTDRVPRSIASSICIDGNSHLVDIKSQPEQDFVANMLKEDPDIHWRIYNTNPKNVGAWIGLKVSLKTGDLEWSDGTPLEFTAWDTDEGRNEPDVDCVRMDSRSNFEWNDRDCLHHFSFVCERDSDMKMSTPSYVKPHGSAVSDSIDGNHGNITGHASNNHEGDVFAIEVAYPFLTIIIAVIVGLAVYRIYLRKKARNSASTQSLTPATVHRNSFSLQNQAVHGYVEIEDDHHPQSPPQQPLCSILPPKPPPMRTPNNVNNDDVRTSLQTNGYIEFKSQNNGKSNTPKPSQSNFPPNSHLKQDNISAAEVRTSMQSNGYIEFKSKHDITHTYFNPNKHGFRSSSSIKHTYFKPGTRGNKP